MKIWCLEDDENINNLVTYALQSAGYQVEGFTNSQNFLDNLEQSLPDLVILDVMLPDIDGLEVLKNIRHNSHTQDIPVIMLTAKTAEIDKVKALDIGACVLYYPN